MSHLGRRVEGDIQSGLVGTVVNENASWGRWPRTEPTYDVLWDDGTCSRRVARSILEERWRFRQEPRRSAEECRNRWFDFAIALSRQLEQRHARAGVAADGGPGYGQDRSLPPLVLQSAAEGGGAQSLAEATVPKAKAARLAAKAALHEQFPGVDFAVHCERRVLHVSWLDGPLAGAVWKRLAPLVDQGLATALRAERALSETLVQAAVDYCLWVACPSEPDRDRMALRANAQAYLEGGLELVRASAGPASGLSFQSLVRCVLERWDDCNQVFHNTKKTQGLVSEMAALFADDEQAARQFRVFRAAAAAAPQRTREALSQLASPRAQRERQ